MRKTTKSPGEKIVKDIKRATRKHYSSEEKIRIVLDGLRGEDSIAELCRREGISQGSGAGHCPRVDRAINVPALWDRTMSRTAMNVAAKRKPV